METYPKIIAVDFDGCLVEDRYPEIGDPIMKNINKLKEEQTNELAKIILWTCRTNERLQAAIDFCTNHGIHFDAVNENLPIIIETFGSDGRKIFADEYWDDRSVLMSEKDIGDFSDGYHTFNALYEQRLYLSAALFNNYKDRSWKSWNHSDGEPCFEGQCFIVGIDTPLGQYTYHYKYTWWDIFDCKELDMAPKWDGHTDKDADRLMSLGSVPEVCCESQRRSELVALAKEFKTLDEFAHSIWRACRELIRAIKDIFIKKPKSWAEREVDLACEHERSSNGTPDGEWDYGCACYESALKAYKSLMSDRHSGFSIGATKQILVRLIESKPLTPIEDTDDVWNDVSSLNGPKEDVIQYQCKRMSALFKYVYTDGRIKYNDVDAHYCVDIHNGNTYHSGLVQRLMDEMFPITMPYMPDEPIKVYCEDILTDRKNGDFDTVSIFYMVNPNDEKIELNRFFKESNSDYGWIEITEEEYLERKKTSTWINDNPNLNGSDILLDVDQGQNNSLTKDFTI